MSALSLGLLAVAKAHPSEPICRVRAVAFLFVTTLFPEPAISASAPVPPRAGMTLVFHDEFAGTRLDRRKWTTLHPDGYRRLPGNDEAETYVDEPSFLSSRGLPAWLYPFSVTGGSLHIRARSLSAAQSTKLGAGFISGMVTTFRSCNFTYGYVEVRAKLPSGDGTWPAAWLMHEGVAPYLETDIVETLGHEPAIVYSTIHHGANWASRKIEQAKYTMSNPNAFHVFAVDWQPDATVFFVDGKETSRFATSPESNRPMYLILNLAVGGKWSNSPKPSDFPKTMEIDYVRVWQSSIATPRE